MSTKASCFALLSAYILLFNMAHAQNMNQPSISVPKSSWPHVYPRMPTGDYSPAWQDYFQVTENLPNITWSLPRNWAGNIPVQRAGHPNDTLFFWAFESSNGSLTANSTEPWAIWLNGGPGGSSLFGLLFENGPIHILGNYSVVENQYTWANIADYVWIDQPVGAGFSTADTTALVPDEDQLGADFMGFLRNFVQVFPNLATRPLYLTGESYAGVYIPYIAKAYFGMSNPPVNLAGIAIGDGALANLEAIVQLPVVSVLETYPQVIGYDREVFDYFKQQSALCGYNLTLQYPQPGHFPTLNAPSPSQGGSGATSGKLTEARFMLDVQDRLSARLTERGYALSGHEERLYARDVWKRDLAGRANGTIDPWYQCDLYQEMIDYAINFTFPWSSGGKFNSYNIPDALSPEATADASVFLNDAQTRAAMHAPTSKDWTASVSPFAPSNGSTNVFGDPSVEPTAFLSDLATNMTAHNMKVVVYSANDDSLVPHFGSQIAIQNTTFGGIQGFTGKPDTPWYNDAGEFGGIVHQERNWTYVLVAHAGHLVGYTNPISALTLVREFIFGHNQTGLVIDTSKGTATVVGGEVSSLANEIMTGQAAIYYGNATTASSYLFPSATVAAWDAFIATASARLTARNHGHAVRVQSTSGVFAWVLGIMIAVAVEMVL